MNAPFSPRRNQHQATRAEITGEIPTAALLYGYTTKDGSSTGDASQELLGYRGIAFGWSGCLDAPDLLPLGGVRAVYISSEVGGMGFEGMAARSQHREKM